MNRLKEPELASEMSMRSISYSRTLLAQREQELMKKPDDPNLQAAYKDASDRLKKAIWTDKALSEAVKGEESRKHDMDKLDVQHGYKTEEECYADRHNCRSEWFDLICAYNVPDPSRLGREIFNINDIYCGLRNKKEFHAMRNTGVFDYAIWVDRSDYLPLEDTSSMNLEQWMTDFTIDNNGSLDQLHFNTHQLINHLLKIRS
jgi:hypothetical protein